VPVGTPYGACTLVFSDFVSFRSEGASNSSSRRLRASLGGGERLELCVGGRVEILAVTAHESAYSSATTRSNPPADTSQLLSQGSGEANLLRLRGTDREHRVKVCVLAPQKTQINSGVDAAV
jgi:hypothetical protein